jgi:glutathione-regulated potassium-efflux system ancillary protein KefF
MSICLVHAHPRPRRSLANRALLAAVDGLPGLELRSLYDRYPDYDIDVAAEQQALSKADVLVLQHPLYWYSMPALAKLWIDEVFAAGWAYAGGRELAGKRMLWTVTAGGDAGDYTEQGVHERAFDDFVAPLRQTAHFCGMRFLDPFVVAGAHRIDAAALARRARAYRALLESLAAEPKASR